MHAGFLDMFHYAGNQDVSRIGKRIHIDLGGIFEKSIDQHGAFLGKHHGLAHVLPDRVLVVGDYHGSAAKYITRAHQHWVSNPARNGASLLDAGGASVRRARNTEIVE